MLRNLTKTGMIETEEKSADLIADATTFQSLQLQNAQLMSEVERLKAQTSKKGIRRKLKPASLSLKRMVTKRWSPSLEIRGQEKNGLVRTRDRKKSRLQRLLRRKRLRKFASLEPVPNNAEPATIIGGEATLDRIYIPPESEQPQEDSTRNVMSHTGKELANTASQNKANRPWSL